MDGAGSGPVNRGTGGRGSSAHGPGTGTWGLADSQVSVGSGFQFQCVSHPLGPIPRVSVLEGLRWGASICISDESPVTLLLLVVGLHWEPAVGDCVRCCWRRSRVQVGPCCPPPGTRCDPGSQPQELALDSGCGKPQEILTRVLLLASPFS